MIVPGTGSYVRRHRSEHRLRATIDCLSVRAHVPEDNEAYYTMRLAQFRVTNDPDQPFDFRAFVREVAYLQYGPPAVVYKGPPDADDAFVIAWKYPNGCFSTSKKGADLFDGLDPADEVEHCNALLCDPNTPSIANCVQLGPPALLANSFAAEVWAVGNDFFTFPQ